MTSRIVLSVLLGTLLAGFAACETTNGGIGTSPSEPEPTSADPVGSLELAMGKEDVPAACGVWIRDTAELADAASLAGEPPDVVAFAGEHASCVDAVTIADVRYPGRSFVRRVKLVSTYSAYEATP